MLSDKESKKLMDRPTDWDAGYVYPGLIDFRPNSDKPEVGELVQQLTSMAKRAYDSLSERRLSHQEMDNSMTAFIPADQEEALRKSKDPRLPVSIVLPFTYASYEALSTPWLGRYLGEDEIHRYRAGGPEDIIGAILAEKHIALQSGNFQEIGALNTAIRDVLVYGPCAVYLEWKELIGTRRETKFDLMSDPMTGEMVPDPATLRMEEVEGVRFEGNKVHSIDPYRLITDNNVPIHLNQDGQFSGFTRRTDVGAILSREQTNKIYFNGKYLRGRGDLTNTMLYEDYEAGGERVGGRGTEDAYDESLGLQAPVEELHLWATILPNEWGLEKLSKGNGEKPEKFYFCIAGGEVLLACEPLRDWHNQYPIFIGAPYTDGYAATPLGGLEFTYGIQHLINYMLNTRVAFLLLAQYGRWAVDTSKVDRRSLVKGKHGLFIELQRIAHGTKVGDYIQQFPFTDVTAGNMGDVMLLYEWLQRSTGATDPLIGMLAQKGERVTATEARGAKVGALGRIDKLARVFDDQFMYPLGRAMLSNTSQYLSNESYVKMAGRHEDELRQEYTRMGGNPEDQFFPIRPGDIDPFYDVIASGTSAKGEEQFPIWTELTKAVFGNEFLASQIDPIRWLKHIARIGGAENVGDFIQQGGMVAPVVAGPGQQGAVDSAVENGNLVPIPNDRSERYMK